MTDFRSKYKQKGLGFGNLERSRISRASEQDDRRKEIRAQNFSKLRPLTENAQANTPGPSVATISRNEKLQKWKQEKEMKKKTEKGVIKPPFKVGVVHHRVFSPPINGPSAPSCSHSSSHVSVRPRIQKTVPVKRVTRVTEKRLAAKAAAIAVAKAAQKKSFAPANHQFRPPTGIPNIPLFGRVKKGSIDAEKLSWNFSTEKGITTKTEAQDSLTSERKKANLVIQESSRSSEKFEINQKEDEPMNANSYKEADPRISGSDKRGISDSSIDSMLRVSSDDPEVFDSPVAESSCINVDMQKKESTLEEMVVISTQPTAKQISPPKSIKKSTSPAQKDSQSNLEENNVPVLEINSSQLEKDTAVQVAALQKAAEAPEISPKSAPEKTDSSSSESAEKPLDDSFSAAFCSPYVVTRRGKKEARKEQKSRRGLGQSPEEIPTKETIMQSLNISIEEEKRTSQYFRCLIESEAKRLQEQCNHWTNIVSIENPPEEAQYIVQQAVGQTKLLLAKKFKRFESLVLDCETGNGLMLVTCKDLQGFWDIVYMEIKNCEDRFSKLEELKARGWKEEDEVEKPPPKRLVKKKSPKKIFPNKSPKKVPARSSLRAMILAARQKKKEIEENSEDKPADEVVVEIWKNVVRNESPSKVTSTKRTSSITPQRLTPNEKSKSFPLAVMAISQKCKTPEENPPNSRVSLETHFESEMDTEDGDVEIVNFQVQMDESISYINSKHTPGKSILKRVKVENSSDTSDDSRLAKSTQKVIFNDNVELKEVEVDEEEGTKASLAADLSRTDSLEFDSEFVSEMEIRAERKLNFEDESFNETMDASLREDAVFEDEEQPVYKTLVIPELKLIPATPRSPRVSKKKRTELENSILEETVAEEAAVQDEEIPFTRSLRNRTIVGNLTPRSAKRLKNSANRGKSPRMKKDNSILQDDSPDEKNKTLDLIESLNHSLRSSKKIPKSPRATGKSPRMKKDNCILQDDNPEESSKTLDLNESLNHSLRSSKKTPKSPRMTGNSPRMKKDNWILQDDNTEENSKILDLNESLHRCLSSSNKTPKSPRVTGKSPQMKKDNRILQDDIPKESSKILDLNESLNRSLRSSKKTPKSPRVTGKSPQMEKDNRILQDEIPEENSKILDLNESLNRSLRSKKTPKSPRVTGKSPRQKSKRQAPSPYREDQEQSDEEPPKRSEEDVNSSVSSPKETRSSKGKSLQQSASGGKSENESPVARFVKKAARKTSLLYNLMKSPISTSKKAKEISKVLEKMQIDSETESEKTDSPAKSLRSILKRVKTPNESMKRENKTKVEEEISKEKMQVDENVKSEKKFNLAKLFATPNVLSQTKSPRHRRKVEKDANESSVDEMKDESSGSNVDPSTLKGIPVNVQERTENFATENFTDSLEAQKNPVKRTSMNYSNNGNILNETDVNYNDSKKLNQSLKESTISKPRRSELIPLNDIYVEKENKTPSDGSKILKRQYSVNAESPRVSPKPIETPSRRKSIKRSRSCHMEECALAVTSSPSRKRSKSIGLVKTPTVRRTVNLMSFDTP